MNFQGFHFHIYFDPHRQQDEVELLVKKLEAVEKIQIGRIWKKPVGPHPIGSCQITVLPEDYLRMTHWFMENREGLDVFIHGLTGDDIIDHTKYVAWIGKSHDLNLKFFGL